MSLDHVTCDVPNSPGFGPEQDCSGLTPTKCAQLTAGTTGVELWASLDGTNFGRVGSVPGGQITQLGFLPAVKVKAKRVAGSGVDSLVVAGEEGSTAFAPFAGISFDDPGAATDTTLIPFGDVRAPHTVTQVTLNPQSTVAADGTNFKTITILAYSAAGVLRGTVASITTVAGFTAQVTRNYTLGAYVSLVAGDQLYLSTTHGGTGADMNLTRTNLY